MKLNYTDTASQLQHSREYPVILMHGMFGSLSNLGPIGRHLTEHGYRVIAVDMRNHGLSPHEDNMSYADMAADIVELMDSLKIERAHLLGHSMGGKVGMQIAMNYPQRVAKLIVADIAPVTYAADRHNAILDGLQALANTELASRKQADEILADYEPEAGIRAFLLKNLYRYKEAEGHAHFGLRLNLASVLANYFDVLTLAPSGEYFDGAVLFLKGANSAYIQDKHRQMIEELFPRSQLKIIDGAGHWLHAEQAAAFNQHCLDFLA
jgi:esterase